MCKQINKSLIEVNAKNNIEKDICLHCNYLQLVLTFTARPAYNEMIIE